MILEEMLVDAVPVDTCANLILACAWETDKRYRDGDSQVKVYNHVSGNAMPLTWGEIYNIAKNCLFSNPLERMVWYPGGSFKRNSTINRVHELLFHDLPANLTDLVVRLFGGKPFAVHLCGKMTRGMRSLEYFTTHQWTWSNTNTENLSKSLDQRDRETFYWGLEDIEWHSFIQSYVMG